MYWRDLEMLKKYYLFKRKYLWTISLWFSISFFSLTLLSLFFVYHNIEKVAIQNELINNQRFLKQIMFNIEFMDTTVKKLCLGVYANLDAQDIMTRKHSDPDILDVIQKMNNITSSIMPINSYIDSIYIYNKEDNIYYTNRGSLLFNDILLKEYINDTQKAEKTIPQLKPVSRNIRIISGEKNKEVNVLSYFLFNGTSEGIINGGIILNVKPDWIMNSIKKISLEKSENDFVYMIDGKGDFIGESDISENLLTYLEDVYITYRDSQSEEKKIFGLVEKIINNKLFFISYMYVEQADLFILFVQQENLIFNYINTLRSSTIIVSLLFLFISLIVAMTISRKIYEPINNLIEQIKFSIPKCSTNTDLVDEFYFITHAFLDSAKKLENYEKERISVRSTKKLFFLRKLIIDSSSVTQKELDSANREDYLQFNNHNSCFVVAIARINNYKAYNSSLGDYDLKRLKYSIANIIRSSISTVFKNESFDYNEDQIEVIVELKDTYDRYIEKLNKKIREAQNNITKQLHVSVSFSISESETDIHNLTKLYKQALDISIYRFIYGGKCLLDSSIVSINLKNTQIDYSFKYENKIVDILRTNKLVGLKTVLETIFIDISHYNINNLKLSILHLLNTIHNCLNEINSNRISPISIDFVSLHQEINEKEELGDVRQVILDVLEDYIKNGSNSVLDKQHTLIADTALDIIHTKYFENSMCLDSISILMKMSSKKLGQIFKEQINISIPQYISEYRLKKALEWLEKSDLTINEIILKVGIGSETYFYSKFKKKFGVTPKQYMLNKAISNIKI